MRQTGVDNDVVQPVASLRNGSEKCAGFIFGAQFIHACTKIGQRPHEGGLRGAAGHGERDHAAGERRGCRRSAFAGGLEG